MVALRSPEFPCVLHKGTTSRESFAATKYSHVLKKWHDFVFWLYLLQLSARDCSNRRKFRSQTSGNMGRWKAEQGRGREKRKIRRKKSRRERERRQKMQMREKVGKSRNTVVFPMICVSGGSKSRLAKAAGAEPSGPDERWKIARRCGAKHISKSKV